MLVAPALWTAKAAILALYIRLFDCGRWIRISCYALMAFMLVFYGCYVVLAAVYCLPRHGRPWNIHLYDQCAKQPISSSSVMGVFGVEADMVIFVLPFPIIYTLHLTRKRKIGLFVVFLVGLL